MEASALHAPSRLSRLSLGTPLLRLRSDEQLVALFRAGSDDAFGVLHDRYRQRLFAYVRQMLSGHSRQDAEDVLQDVFVRAFGALRGDERAVNVRAWLYRVAHNRCIDHLRRPHPPAAEIFEMSRKPLLDPVEEAQRRDDLKRLVADVGRLPEQQRSALLMREIDGLSYADLAGALDVTVPAVKSLLVRARVGLVEAQESRDADCTRDPARPARLLRPRREGLRPRPPAHARVRRLPRVPRRAPRACGARSPRWPRPAPAPLALLAKLLGGGGAAAAGGGGGAALLGGATTAATACKVAAVVCATAITAGGAVEVSKLTPDPAPKREQAGARAPPRPRAAPAARGPPIAVSPAATAHARPRARIPARPPPRATATAAGGGGDARRASERPLTAPPPAAAPYAGHDDPPRRRRRRAAGLLRRHRRAGGDPAAAGAVRQRRRAGDRRAARGGAARAEPPVAEPAAPPAAEPAVPAADARPVGRRRRRRPSTDGPVGLRAHRTLPRDARPRGAPRAARNALRPVHGRRRPLDRARSVARRLPDVGLRRRRAPRCATRCASRAR